ncbi:hypothetical protein CRUP_017142 [Coryphaenoides rupestris]|nr:hypothetical protein CRUP_017142 [Coryphaenoides rupestris]
MIITARPWATLSLLTGWSEAFSTDRLDLKCEVKGGQGPWNYTWTRGGQELLTYHEKHIVTPDEDPDQSQYVCRGIRTSRPFYSTPSEPFKTTNLLLKRRMLLSISGCLFFGIIAVFLGCIVMRIKRKPVNIEDREEEPNLFFTMAELKACNVAPCPLADYVTDEALAALTKDGEAGDTPGESTPLPIRFPECEAETSESLHPEDHNGLTSFKY